MADGYEVDLSALRAAADGIARTVDQVAAHPVRSLATGAGVLGHDRLAGSLTAFSGRWHDGVTHLVEDGRSAGEHLTVAAAAYLCSEDATQGSLDDVLRRPGPDPAPR
ncbi:hypothetical protein [Actinomycetospora sp. NBRC 106375]|uniref:hypothetical protein n=1 Tax=Actinomycetospora sp. NBRC 106375 TaxID=3032207 RepID=UPI00255389B5|nr:hypothetical protein [Actinomycetospora sp. NBRC 106375]